MSFRSGDRVIALLGADDGSEDVRGTFIGSDRGWTLIQPDDGGIPVAVADDRVIPEPPAVGTDAWLAWELASVISDEIGDRWHNGEISPDEPFPELKDNQCVGDLAQFLTKDGRVVTVAVVVTKAKPGDGDG
jgi:hypothetical protein